MRLNASVRNAIVTEAFKKHAQENISVRMRSAMTITLKSSIDKDKAVVPNIYPYFALYLIAVCKDSNV